MRRTADHWIKRRARKGLSIAIWTFTIVALGVFAEDEGISQERICREVAHSLGQVAQHKRYTPELHRWLLKRWGNPDLPTDYEQGYRYCWKCSCDGDRHNPFTSPCCLFVHFDWRIRTYTWPNCK